MKRALTEIRKNGNIFAIFLLLCFIGCVFNIRCYFRVLTGDEVTFQYALNDNYVKTDDRNFPKLSDKKISSISEIIAYQKDYYQHNNGRSLVHASEQIFTDHALAFSIVNSLIFIFFVTLLVAYASNGRLKETHFSLWLFTIIALIYLFPVPHRLWVSVNMAPNYLWPSTLAVALLIIWNKIEQCRINNIFNVPIALISFFFGWSNEAFVVGFCGGFILYYIIYPRKFNIQLLWIAIPLLAGTYFLVSSPGNFIRFKGEYTTYSTIIFNSLANAIANIFQLKIFWIFIITSILTLVFGNSTRFIAFLKYNKKIVLIFLVTFFFTLFANTGPWTCTFMEIIALMLAIKYIYYVKLLTKKIFDYIIPVILATFVIVQIILANDTIKWYYYQKNAFDSYITDYDGIAVVDKPEVSILSTPFLSYYYNPMPQVCSFHFRYNLPTQPIFLNKYDFDALISPEIFFTQQNRFTGNAPIYHSENSEYFWIMPDSINCIKKITASLYPVDPLTYFIISAKNKQFKDPSSFPTKQDVVIDTIVTRYGKSYRITPPFLREIKSFDNM